MLCKYCKGSVRCMSLQWEQKCLWHCGYIYISMFHTNFLLYGTLFLNISFSFKVYSRIYIALKQYKLYYVSLKTGIKLIKWQYKITTAERIKQRATRMDAKFLLLLWDRNGHTKIHKLSGTFKMAIRPNIEALYVKYNRFYRYLRHETLGIFNRNERCKKYESWVRSLRSVNSSSHSW